MQQGKPTIIYPDRRFVSISAVKTADPQFLKWDLDHRIPCYVYNPDESRVKDGSYAVSAKTGSNQRLIVQFRQIARETRRFFYSNWPLLVTSR